MQNGEDPTAHSFIIPRSKRGSISGRDRRHKLPTERTVRLRKRLRGVVSKDLQRTLGSTRSGHLFDNDKDMLRGLECQTVRYPISSDETSAPMVAVHRTISRVSMRQCTPLAIQSLPPERHRSVSDTTVGTTVILLAFVTAFPNP